MNWIGLVAGVAIGACSIPVPLYASSCFEHAASAISSEHLFNAHSLPQLTNSEGSEVRHILDALRGHWTGVANGYWCLGTAQNPVRNPDDYKVEADINVSGVQRNRRLELDATLRSERDNGAHQETLVLFLEKSQFYVDTHAQADNPHMQERSIASDRISFAQMAYPPTAVRVINRSIEIHGDSMIYRTEIYTHDIMTSAIVWRLSRNTSRSYE